MMILEITEAREEKEILPIGKFLGIASCTLVFSFCTLSYVLIIFLPFNLIWSLRARELINLKLAWEANVKCGGGAPLMVEW